MSRFILASASPRRRELLARVGLDFRVLPADLDEAPERGEDPSAFALRAATEKAAAIAAEQPGAFVLGADTIVVQGETILGKPRNAAAARDMLVSLQSRAHVVSTGYCILGPTAEHRARVVSTKVTMKSLAAWEIEAYLATMEWTDKAGAYAVQGRGAYLVRAIEGSYTNVVGLPLTEVIEDLLALGAITPEHVFG